KHVGERGELRRVIDGQAHGVGGRGAWCGCALAPAVEQLLETHRSAPVQGRMRARAAHSSVVPAKFRLFLVDRRSPNAVSEISSGASAEGTAAVVSGAAARVASPEAKEVGMFKHIGLKVKDVDASVHFYTASLTPLGYEITSQDETVAAFTHADGSSLWLYADARLAHSLLHI